MSLTSTSGDTGKSTETFEASKFLQGFGTVSDTDLVMQG